MPNQKLYWDSSCFICFLNEAETNRRLICEDILKCAKGGKVDLVTSTWTIVEVIRPKVPGNQPLPKWAIEAAKAVEKKFPNVLEELQILWRRYQSANSAKKLTKIEIEKIDSMFQWEFLQKVQLDEFLANNAVEIARKYGMKPPDAVHGASAIFAEASILQSWDRDFSMLSDQIANGDPQFLSDADRGLLKDL